MASVQVKTCPVCESTREDGMRVTKRIDDEQQPLLVTGDSITFDCCGNTWTLGTPQQAAQAIGYVPAPEPKRSWLAQRFRRRMA